MTVEWGDRREGVMPEDAASLCRLVVRAPGPRTRGRGLQPRLPVRGAPHAAERRTTSPPSPKVWRRSWACGSASSAAATPRASSSWTPAPCRAASTTCAWARASSSARDSICGVSLPGTHTDTFKAYAEVLEVLEKPSAPEGETGPDALMRTREWPDLGIRRRAVLAMGEIDLNVQWLTPTHPGVTVVGASSDHTVVDVTEADPPVEVGDELEFAADYVAVAVGWASRCAHRRSFGSVVDPGALGEWRDRPHRPHQQRPSCDRLLGRQGARLLIPFASARPVPCRGGRCPTWARPTRDCRTSPAPRRQHEAMDL